MCFFGLACSLVARGGGRCSFSMDHRMLTHGQIDVSMTKSLESSLVQLSPDWIS